LEQLLSVFVRKLRKTKLKLSKTKNKPLLPTKTLRDSDSVCGIEWDSSHCVLKSFLRDSHEWPGLGIEFNFLFVQISLLRPRKVTWEIGRNKPRFPVTSSTRQRQSEFLGRELLSCLCLSIIYCDIVWRNCPRYFPLLEDRSPGIRTMFLCPLEPPESSLQRH
jgi:hypothetical protein